MRLNAYILVADPTWLTKSVGAYYEHVAEIIVSYDRSGHGFTGVPIPVDHCLDLLKKIDKDRKMVLLPGDFANCERTLQMSETSQRQAALDRASVASDWVLQIDTDEFLPDCGVLLRVLEQARDYQYVEWPMRVLFRRLPNGQFLEVCEQGGTDHYEYPGPIALRSGGVLTEARSGKGAVLRMTAEQITPSLQLRQPPRPNEIRMAGLTAGDAIIHNSWGRPASDVKRKIATWSHASWRAWAFYYLKWVPAPLRWRRMLDFHPFAHGLWPALRKSPLIESPSE
jgi:hypothetical protein